MVRVKTWHEQRRGFIDKLPHSDRATSTMLSQRCRKTYQTDLVNANIIVSVSECEYWYEFSMSPIQSVSMRLIMSLSAESG